MRYDSVALDDGVVDSSLPELPRKEKDEKKDTLTLDSKCCQGYHTTQVRFLLVMFLTGITVGLIQLLFHWKPLWRLKLSCIQCQLHTADRILITDEFEQKHVETIKCDVPDMSNGGQTISLKYFMHKLIKYSWNEQNAVFRQIRGLEEHMACSSFHRLAEGLSLSEQHHRKFIYGHNLIDIPVKPIGWLILHEALNPFYIFQVFSSVIWLMQSYWMYTVAVLILSAISIGVTVWETRRQSKALRATVKSSSMVHVLRDNQVWESISSVDLVPGDVMEVPPSGELQCDAILLQGHVVVNESMLTGESMPVTKMSLPNHDSEQYNTDRHRKHTLFCGTQILKTEPIGEEGEIIKALVLRTGFSTLRGDLVRAILYPKPVDMRFYSDGMKFVIVSLIFGLVCVVFTTVSYLKAGASAYDVTLNAMDILTFVVPPSLPATLTISSLYAQRRLKKEGIFCLSSKYINMCGTLNLVCFDKTGTLTEETLTLKGVIPADDLGLMGLEEDVYLIPDLRVKVCMVTCNTLTYIEGQLAGDPLDLLLFQAVGWKMVDRKDADGTYTLPIIKAIKPQRLEKVGEVGIVHQYAFRSALQRLSVVVQESGSPYLDVFTKGSPEVVASLCREDTVPQNLEKVLQEYASQGYRVLALAHRPLTDEYNNGVNIKDVTREEVERELDFLGLVILHNPLKEETQSAVMTLQRADIRTVMVTGDNLFTAIHTARECDMIKPLDDVIIVHVMHRKGSGGIKVYYTGVKNPNIHLSVPDTVEQGILIETRYHFAITGRAFALIKRFEPELLQKIIQRGKIFARMQPDMKAQLVEMLQDLGYTVGMCGDGANDCGALKTANAGVSLSTAEASVASPFTARQAHIGCLPTLIREGRCSLVSCFSLFKHLLASSWVVCVAVLIIYYISCDMFDVQYLYMDIALIVLPSLFFAQIEAYPVLVKQPPPTCLADVVPIASLLSFLLIHVILLTAVWKYLHSQPWFVPWVYGDSDFSGYENTLVFLMISMATIFSSLVFNRGPPYRKPLYTNILLTVCLSLLGFVCVLYVVFPIPFLINIFKLKFAPSIRFHIVLLFIGLADLLLCLLIEDYIINIILHQHVIPWITRRRGAQLKYEQLEQEIASDPCWPPLDHVPRKRNSAFVCYTPEGVSVELECGSLSDVASRGSHWDIYPAGGLLITQL